MPNRPISIRTDSRPWVRLGVVTFLASFVMLAAGSIVGQLRAHHFAGLGNNALTALVPLAGFGALYLLVMVSSFVFPAKLTEFGLRCYKSPCRYPFLSWRDISQIDAWTGQSTCRISVQSALLKDPLEFLLRPNDFATFRSAIATYPQAASIPLKIHGETV
jgi:hypothetical protein